MDTFTRVGLEISPREDDRQWRYKLTPLNGLCNNCMTPGELDVNIEHIIDELKEISRMAHADYDK